MKKPSHNTNHTLSADSNTIRPETLIASLIGELIVIVMILLGISYFRGQMFSPNLLVATRHHSKESGDPVNFVLSTQRDHTGSVSMAITAYDDYS